MACEDIANAWDITADGGIIICSKEYKDSPVVIHGTEFREDLIVIDNSGFDVIHGVDWLGAVHAVIGCQEKKVVFRIPGCLKFEFHAWETPYESVKYSGVQRAGLLSVLEAAEETIPPIVKEFSVGFLEDLLDCHQTTKWSFALSSSWEQRQSQRHHT